jgi:hypothetical protein
LASDDASIERVNTSTASKRLATWSIKFKISKLIYTSPLSLHKDVNTDLEDIRAASPDAHAKIAALIRQLRADTKLAEKLLDHGFGDGRKEAVSVNK